MIKAILDKYYNWRIKDLEVFLLKKPNDVETLNYLATCYEWRKDYIKAEELIKKAIAIAPNNKNSKEILELILRNKNKCSST